MDIFEYKGKKYISINGKDYFLLRGYGKNNNRMIFIQVSGSTPLRKEDLPNKEWEVMKTKSGKRNVWTAYNKKWFRYDTTKENNCMAFIGATTKASYFIALRHISMKFNLSMNDDEIEKIVNEYINDKKYKSAVTEQEDMGNSGESMVMIDFCYMDEKEAKRILKREEKKAD